MLIKIIESEGSSIGTSTLHSIAKNRTAKTRIFLAKHGKVELGIMTIDFYSPPEPLFVYMIYVEKTFRGKNIGNTLLNYAEKIAKERGNPSVVLEPHEIEDNSPVEMLTSWYMRRGYSRRIGDPSRMEKVLNK